MELNSKTETLPQGKPVPQNMDAEFSKIVEQSKQNIQNTEPSPAKRGRGRPRKERPAGDGSPQTQKPAAEGPTQTPTPDISKYLVPPLMAISKIPAEKHKIPELALSPDEAGACAHSLNECLNAFAPSLNSMSPQTAAVLGACMTFGSIGFQKYQLYELAMAKRRVEKPVETETAPPVQHVPSNGVEAESFFRVERAM